MAKFRSHSCTVKHSVHPPSARIERDSSSDLNAFGNHFRSTRKAPRSHEASVPSWRTITCAPVATMWRSRERIQARPTLRTFSRGHQTTYVAA